MQPLAAQGRIALTLAASASRTLLTLRRLGVGELGTAKLRRPGRLGEGSGDAAEKGDARSRGDQKVTVDHMVGSCLERPRSGRT